MKGERLEYVSSDGEEGGRKKNSMYSEVDNN